MMALDKKSNFKLTILIKEGKNLKTGYQTLPGKHIIYELNTPHHFHHNYSIT